MTIQVQRNRSQRAFLKNIVDKLRQRHSTYALGIVTLKLEIITISSVTDSKRIETFRLKTNYLDIFITACPEIKINFLLDTCNFHRKFRFIFSLNLSEITQNVQLREAKFQNFHGEHAPGSPYSVLAPSLLDPISAGLTLKCFRWSCYYQWAIVSIILRILITQKHVSFFH